MDNLVDDFIEINYDFGPCLARNESGYFLKDRVKPHKRIQFTLPCPGLFCEDVELDWFCTDCDQRIEYGFDLHFYCDCGAALTSLYDFKCSQQSHGEGFNRFDY